MLKIMTINMWRYHDWEQRKETIVALINEQQPDCIVLQEVLTNHAFSDFPSSDYIAEACGYAYSAFTPTLVRTDSKDQNGERTQRASEGQAILSRFPIKKVESYYLKLYPEYPEEKAVMLCKIATDDGDIDIINVHFANSEVAYAQLDELLQLVEARKLKPIIAGDFNIYDLAHYKAKSPTLQRYQISSELENYVSYPDDNDSLDYIVADSSMFVLQDVTCHEAYVSDHRALSATIRHV